MEISLYKESQKVKMLKRGNIFNTYGRVFVINMKKIKYFLNVLELVIPLTFFTLSILGSYLEKRFGNKELLRFVIEE